MSIARQARVVLVITLFTVLYGVAPNVGSLDPLPPSVPAVDVYDVPPASAIVPDRPVAGSVKPDAAVDLYGNEVTDAIATYTLDATGILYEEHSPQTELPRLGSPTS